VQALVFPLQANAVAIQLGAEKVDAGDTACEVPLASCVYQEDRKGGKSREEAQVIALLSFYASCAF
jgi:hypothetical protein